MPGDILQRDAEGIGHDRKIPQDIAQFFFQLLPIQLMAVEEGFFDMLGHLARLAVEAQGGVHHRFLEVAVVARGAQGKLLVYVEVKGWRDHRAFVCYVNWIRIRIRIEIVRTTLSETATGVMRET